MKWAAMMLAILMIFITTATAEEADLWILCQPGSYVCARGNASKKAEVLGRLELGEKVRTDGKRRNGYIHCIGLWFEESDGWIHSGYLADEEPEVIEGGDPYIICAPGRTACRKWIGGPRISWARNCAEFTVWAATSEWLVTSRGFIRTQYTERST